MNTRFQSIKKSTQMTPVTNLKRNRSQCNYSGRGSEGLLGVTECKTKYNPTRLKWNDMLDQLMKYKETNGDCIVPRGFSLNPKLATWVSEQRKQYKLKLGKKKSYMSDERTKLLNDIGFAWNVHELVWKEKFELLKEFKKQHGHCMVPVKNIEIGFWVKEQRRHYWLKKKNKQT